MPLFAFDKFWKLKFELDECKFWPALFSSPSECYRLLIFSSLTSNRWYLSYDVCLEIRAEIIRTVLWCLVYWSHKHTWMSKSYSSLDWVLSHWAHFTVCRLICVYLCVFCVFLFHTAYVLYHCNTVRWTWWDWSLILRTYLPSVLWHCCWVTWPIRTCPRYDL